jgi:ribose 5-phosphate isomerase B
MKKILIASDHAGFELKNELMPFLRDLGYEVQDFGANIFDAEDDYPDFIAPLARAVSESGGEQKGIILGGSGQGEAIVANRFPNVRAVVFNGQYKTGDGRHIPEEIIASREHNDANILSLGARFLSEKDAKDAVEVWLATPFSNDERHTRRIKKINEIKVN